MPRASVCSFVAVCYVVAIRYIASIRKAYAHTQAAFKSSFCMLNLLFKTHIFRTLFSLYSSLFYGAFYTDCFDFCAK